MWSFFEFLNDDSVVTVLDVGAAMLGSPPYQSLVDAKRARLIGFEPDADACRKLNETFGEPHRFFPCFIGDGKPGTYFQTNWGPTGSLFTPNTPLLDKFQLLAELTTVIEEHSVATQRLDDIPEIDDVDFVKIDVQGSELNVLRNGRRVIDSALLIQTEVAFVEYYKGQPMFSDVDAFLRRNGYQFHDFAGIGSRSFKPLVNSRNSSPNPAIRSFRQGIWADAYYVKDWMKLDKLTPPKLKKYAALMHDLVGSYDLAYLVLCEHDRQTGSDHAARYLRLMEDWGRCSVLHPVAFDADWLPVIPEAVSQPGAAHHDPVADIDSILLETDDGILVSVPTSLGCITTYALLEQERWFEKELPFIRDWLEPGMNAVDVGANVGVYSLPMAERVAPGGRVFAFEPGSANRKNLEIGRMANKSSNLCISAYALAESERSGWLHVSENGELNSLGDEPAGSADGERVRVTTLDALEKEQFWPAIDFVKIDAEGHEWNIVEGGRRFFGRQSPLIMLETKHGTKLSPDVRPLFQAMGYSAFRLLGDSMLLVPLADDEAIDAFELNLFLARPDRAARIAETGRLAWGADTHRLAPEEQDEAVARLLDLPFARDFEFSVDDVLGCDLAPALLAYAAYRFLPLPPERKYAALQAAFAAASAACQENACATHRATLARIALALGERSLAIELLRQLFETPLGDLDAPFFPPCERYEEISAVSREKAWFTAAAVEQLELSRSYSSQFVCDGEFGNLQLLCQSPFVSAEMIRRMILMGVMAGMQPAELERYVKSAQRYSHRNADFWAEDALALTVAEACAARKAVMGAAERLPIYGGK